MNCQYRGLGRPAQGLYRPAGLCAGRLSAMAGIRQVRTRSQPFRHRRHRTDAHRRQRALQLQVRERPPRQPAGRPVHRDGFRRPGASQHGRTAADQRTDPDHRPAHRRDLCPGRARPGPAGFAHHGADRQRRPSRIPGAGLPLRAGHRHAARL
ncbi:hypothetical protein G6F57_019845 [Rhizopus arrhizus]|nr:hypothetical protein G6F57_019845 [Rhizopus arrhizus]